MRLELALVSRDATIARVEDAAAEGVVTNMGTEPVTLDLVELTSPSLALEIVDERGRPLLMLPPPTPGRPDLIVPRRERDARYRSSPSCHRRRSPAATACVSDAVSRGQEWLDLEVA